MKTFLSILFPFIIGLYAGFYTNPDTFSIYLVNDIAHVNMRNRTISFEVQDTTYSYHATKDMFDFIEKKTAQSTNLIGYKNDLNYLVYKGYIFAQIQYNDDEQYMELIYEGPNWTIDANRDTSYVISYFNTVERLYNPNTKSIFYEAYNID